MPKLTKDQAYRNPTGRQSRDDVRQTLTLHVIPDAQNVSVFLSNKDNPVPGVAADWVAHSTTIGANSLQTPVAAEWIYWTGGGDNAEVWPNFENLTLGEEATGGAES